MKRPLVIGGGVAGSTLATHLARAGHQPLLIERQEKAHHKVCGEFLSREAVAYLTDLDISPATLGAEKITHLRLLTQDILGEWRLPFTGWSLSRRALDEALLQRAQEEGVQIRRGVQVQQLLRNECWQARLDTGEILEATDVFGASGKHDLRGHARPRGWQHDLVAFKMHFRLVPTQRRQLQQRVELIWFPGGYAGLEPVEDGVANLCLLIRRETLARLGRRWESVLSHLYEASPPLAARLGGAQALWPKPLAISAIPYGYIRHRSGGIWHLGDQAAVIPSFAGNGISIALHSAQRAAQYYLEGQTAQAYQERLARDLRWPVMLATILSLLMVRGYGQYLLGGVARHLPLAVEVARQTRLGLHSGGAARRGGHHFPMGTAGSSS